MANPDFETLNRKWATIGPGLIFALGVAGAALGLEWLLRSVLQTFDAQAMTPSAIVLALVIGIACSTIAATPTLEPGLAFATKALLRIAVALLGLRIVLSDIIGLGPGVAIAIPVSMAITVAFAIWFANAIGCTNRSGALSGSANAICGASAAMATSTILPDSRNKDAEVIATVVLANAVSTLALITYPLLCGWLEFSPRQTGILLGASIQDVAQVVGAGYAVSNETGDTAVIVKMYRVMLLLPTIILMGWWINWHPVPLAGTVPSALSVLPAKRLTIGPANLGLPLRSKAPAFKTLPTIRTVPGFAIAFILLCGVNSLFMALPTVLPFYLPTRQILLDVSSLAMLVAIAALGAGTSVGKLLAIGWIWVTVFFAAAIAMLALSLVMASNFGS